MQLNEIVKSFFIKPKERELSSEIHQNNVLVNLSSEEDGNQTGIFFDNENTVFGFSEVTDSIHAQTAKIQKYRSVAMSPDVDEAIDIIVNEIIFSVDNETPIIAQINIDNDTLVKAISEKFKKITQMTNLSRNFYQIVKRGYVDGQINMHCSYDKKNLKDGIQSIQMIEPSWFYFDKKDNLWKYSSSRGRNSPRSLSKTPEFSPEEIVHENFGLYDGDINLGYLEYAIKSNNMLQTLEDLLIPLRFSRSISRRVFNVDIGDLPNKRGAEVMEEHQRKFKYKKFYNNETGEVTNQQHITSMVEDYWFANRSGGRGTTVDVLDESGNLGELDDILYFAKKLYRALKIPSSRIPGNESSDNEFDFTTTRTTKEDLQFFMFISRLRSVYSNVFREILKREIISSGIMTTAEWEEYEEDIKIVFKENNAFIDRMQLDNFISKLDIYGQAKEYSGSVISVETVMKSVFGMSDEEIKEEHERIEKEKKDPKYARFYEEDDGY